MSSLHHAEPRPPDPAQQGERWRGEMRPDRETLAALAWKRVFRMHRIDLSDPRQATGVQVYRLLSDLFKACAERDEKTGDTPITVTADELGAYLDALVPRVFRRE